MAINIYVGNLPFSTTSEDLSQLFGQYGQVVNTQVVSDRETGRSRGFAFVEMQNKAEAERAIGALNNEEYQGRRLTINEAKPRVNRQIPDLISPPAFAVVWDPRLVTAKEYAEVIVGLNELVQAHGGQGLKRLESKPFAAGAPQVVPV